MSICWALYCIALLGYEIAIESERSWRLTRAIAHGLLFIAFGAAIVRIADCSAAIRLKWKRPMIAELTIWLIFLPCLVGYNLLMLSLIIIILWQRRNRAIHDQTSLELRHQEASRLEEGAGDGQAVELKKVDVLPKMG